MTYKSIIKESVLHLVKSDFTYMYNLALHSLFVYSLRRVQDSIF